ncbi:MAG: hypothetical protein NC429_06945 [Lachnospiraceae bacterium]|nr:hypothetical protein [Lachnospiraceae bacterium]
MSMEHKAYLFDSIRYHSDIEKILDKCCKEKSTIEAEMYIDKHWKELYSPYTGEPLDEEWKKELTSGNLQEYFDILLTACYEWENDIGLGYAWDGVNETLKQINFINNIEKCVLGETLVFHGITIDPGAMGLGIIDEKEVKFIKEKLIQNKEKIESADLPEDLLYEMEKEEIDDAYDDLCGIYTQADKEKKGIMFTF